MKGIDIVLPVGVEISEGSAKRKVGCVIDVCVPVADEDEVPVVVEWRSWRNRWGDNEYRAWRNRLVCKHQNKDTLIDGLLPRTEWKDTAPGEWGNISSLRPLIGWVPARGMEIVQDIDSVPGLPEEVERVISDVAASVVINGHIWFPTQGPVVHVTNAGKGWLRAEVAHPPSAGPSAFHLPALRREYEAVFKHVSWLCTDPVIHSRDGWDMGAILDESDTEILKMMLQDMFLDTYSIRKRMVEDVEIEIMLKAREALEGGERVSIGLACREWLDVLARVRKQNPQVVSGFDIDNMNVVLSVIEQGAAERALDMDGLRL